jgi:hypothetical protein
MAGISQIGVNNVRSNKGICCNFAKQLLHRRHRLRTEVEAALSLRRLLWRFVRGVAKQQNGLQVKAKFSKPYGREKSRMISNISGGRLRMPILLMSHWPCLFCNARREKRKTKYFFAMADGQISSTMIPWHHVRQLGVFQIS